MGYRRGMTMGTYVDRNHPISLAVLADQVNARLAYERAGGDWGPVPEIRWPAWSVTCRPFDWERDG